MTTESLTLSMELLDKAVMRLECVLRERLLAEQHQYDDLQQQHDGLRVEYSALLKTADHLEQRLVQTITLLDGHLGRAAVAA
jgi:hypothetical protein